MHFCPFCGSLLHTEQQQYMQLSCPACPYVYRLTTTITSSQAQRVKMVEKILGGEDDFKYGNKCTVKCPECPNEEALFMELQTRSADEPMTIFYRCTIFNNRSTEAKEGSVVQKTLIKHGSKLVCSHPL